MIPLNRVVLTCLLSLCLSGAALAEEEKAKTEAPHPGVAMKQHEQKIVETLGPEKSKDFLMLRYRFGVVRSVGVVRQDVAAAVKACGDKNAALKADMDKAFADWSGAVDPALERAKKRLDGDVAAASFMEPAEIRVFFDEVDKAAAFADQRIVKQPVTEAEDCKALKNSLGETKTQLSDLLEKSMEMKADKESGAEKDKDKAGGAQ